jgi:hypothetical protein
VSSLGTTFCVLYTVYVPEKHAHSYQPWQLSLPDDTWQMAEMKRSLRDFAALAKSGDQNKIVYWRFDRDYKSYDGISGNDAARRNKLVQAAQDIGLYVYYGRFVHMEEGRPEGWVDPDDCHWRDEPELECDKNGNYVMNYDWDVETSKSVDSFYNIQLSRKENKNLVFYEPDDDHFIQIEQVFSSDDPEFEQDYDGEGGLTHSWSRSVLVMWPRELHAQAVTELFGMGCAYLLDLTAPVDGDHGYTHRESIEIAEKFLLTPGVLEELTYYDGNDGFDFYECRRLFFKFSRLSRRLDLFASTLRKFGLPQKDEDIAIVREAVDTFSSTGNEDSKIQLIDMCLASETNPKKQLELAVKMFGPQVTGGFIAKHFAGKELGAIFTVEDLLKTDKETLRNLYDTLLSTCGVPVLIAIESSRELDVRKTRITG